MKKSRPLLLLLLLAAAVAVMATLARCERANPLLKMYPKSGGDTLDIAVELSPLSYNVSADSVSGLDYELMRQIVAISGRPVKFRLVRSLNDALEGVSAGCFDIVMMSLPATDTMLATYTMTQPLYLDRQVLVQRSDSTSRIDNPRGLANDTVWMVANSPYRQRIDNLAAEIGDTIVVMEMEGCPAEYIVRLVAQGEKGRTVVNEGLARRMKDLYYSELDIDTPVGFNQLQCWIVSEREPGLAADMDRWIDSLKNTRGYDETIDRYGVVRLNKN